MTVGCDLHARQQSIAMVDTETGEFIERTPVHEGTAVRDFYGALEGEWWWASKERGRCSGSKNQPVRIIIQCPESDSPRRGRIHSSIFAGFFLVFSI